MTYRRYVAIGDSSTEGLEDPDGHGGYRGWADRLAAHLADGQDEPLEYANLAIRGLRMAEIRATQFDHAISLQPDLMTVFGGVNDAISWHWDPEAVQADYHAIFGEARARDICVLSFTMPDLTAINPFARRVRDRTARLNDIVRTEADRFGVLVMDFEQYPVTADPRLWFEDRLHGNSLGHQRVAAALAARLGVAGCDESWSSPLEEELRRRRVREQLAGNVEWTVQYLGPWVGRTIRGVPESRGITAKRPVPTVMPKTADTPTAPGAAAKGSRAPGSMAEGSAAEGSAAEGSMAEGRRPGGRRLRRTGLSRGSHPRPLPGGPRTGQTRCAGDTR